MKPKAIILVRVSTQDQDYQRQISDLTTFSQTRGYEIVDVISEKISGAKKNEERAGVQELLKRGRNGEYSKLIIQEISRLSRDCFQAQRIIEELSDLNISVVVQTMGIETLDSKNKRNPLIDMMFTMSSQFASIERGWILNRIKSGQQNAKKRGVHIGRPYNSMESNEFILKKYSSVVRDLKNRISIRKTAVLNNLSTPTVQRVKRILKQEKKLV
jgi:DNA invertase Pin-like site-specific DNA recombinase